MKKVKVSELSGAALDWVVVVCEDDGAVVKLSKPVNKFGIEHSLPVFVERETASRNGEYLVYSPSRDWSQGGPIIERERICLRALAKTGADWSAYVNRGVSTRAALGEPSYGPSPLIAAMRCYVASKFGDLVDIPEELL